MDTSASASARSDALDVKENGTKVVGNATIKDYSIDLSEKTKTR
ncbi:Uncharacterised protein [Actinobacillus equuli]|nr:Uncharacterised protein [Actinobacillus equuli]